MVVAYDDDNDKCTYNDDKHNDNDNAAADDDRNYQTNSSHVANNNYSISQTHIFDQNEEHLFKDTGFLSLLPEQCVPRCFLP
jgi:hypothetical protein